MLAISTLGSCPADFVQRTMGGSQGYPVQSGHSVLLKRKIHVSSSQNETHLKVTPENTGGLLDLTFLVRKGYNVSLYTSLFFSGTYFCLVMRLMPTFSTVTKKNQYKHVVQISGKKNSSSNFPSAFRIDFMKFQETNREETTNRTCHAQAISRENIQRNAKI